MIKRILIVLSFISISHLSFSQYTFTKVHSTELVSSSLIFLEILQSSDDNIWIACQSNKILRFDGNDWILYDNSTLNLDGFSLFKGIYEDQEGRVWFMTSGGGLTYFQEETWTTFTEADGLPTDVNYSAMYYNDKMYFSGSNGVMTYDGETWIDQDIPNVFSTETQLEMDGAGNLWIVFKSNSSAHRLNGTTWEEMSSSTSDICYNELIGMHKTGTGKLWFYGTEGKVCQYDGTTFTNETNLENWGIGLGGKITAIDSDGISDDIWIAADDTGSNGIVHRKNGVNQYYTTEDGLNSNWVKDLIVGNDGQTIYAISVGTLYTGTLDNSVYTENISRKENGWTLFPNPTDGIVQLKNENNTFTNNTVIQIFSIDGRLLSSFEENLMEAIDLNSFPAGWYAFRIISDNEVIQHLKVFKN